MRNVEYFTSIMNKVDFHAVKNIFQFLGIMCVVINLGITIREIRESQYKPQEDILQIESVIFDEQEYLVWTKSGKIVAIVHDPKAYMNEEN